MELRLLAAVAIGAGLGGVARFVLTQAVAAKTDLGAFPIATLVINVTGSFLIGIVIEYARTRASFPPVWRVFLATGVLGGYTTFSTFSVEALALATDGLVVRALVYVLASVMLGILGAFGGIAAVRALTAA